MRVLTASGAAVVRTGPRVGAVSRDGLEKSSALSRRQPRPFYDNPLGPKRAKRNHVRQLEALGYHQVTLQPAA